MAGGPGAELDGLQMVHLSEVIGQSLGSPRSAAESVRPVMRLVEALKTAGTLSTAFLAWHFQDGVLNAVEKGWIGKATLNEIAEERLGPDDFFPAVLGEVISVDESFWLLLASDDDLVFSSGDLYAYRIHCAYILGKLSSLAQDQEGMEAFLSKEASGEKEESGPKDREDRSGPPASPAMFTMSAIHNLYSRIQEHEQRWQSLLGNP